MAFDRIGTILSTINNVIHRVAQENILYKIFGLAPSTARGNVHVGATNDGICSIQFNINQDQPTVHAIGKLHWNETDGTLEIGLLGGEVIAQLGQEHLIRVYNNSGSDMVNGAVVYVEASGDQKPRIKLADADNTDPIPEAVVVGFCTEDIAYETQGYITSSGLVRDIDTSNLVEGDPVWLSTTPGAFTKDVQVPPNHKIFLGHCIRQHNSQGIILASIVAVPTLRGLSDVLSGSPNNGDILKWSAANSRWEISAP